MCSYKLCQVIARLREMLTNVEKEQLWVQWTEALRVTPPLEPHPEGPSSPLLAAIAHPIAGAVLPLILWKAHSFSGKLCILD